MRGRPRGEGKRAGGVARGRGRPGKRKKGSGLGQSGVRKWSAGLVLDWAAERGSSWARVEVGWASWAEGCV